MYIANKIGCLDTGKYGELNERVARISGMIANLIKALKKGR